MKKNTVKYKNANIVFVSFVLALTVFFCSFGGIVPAFASESIEINGSLIEPILTDEEVIQAFEDVVEDAKLADYLITVDGVKASDFVVGDIPSFAFDAMTYMTGNASALTAFNTVNSYWNGLSEDDQDIVKATACGKPNYWVGGKQTLALSLNATAYDQFQIAATAYSNLEFYEEYLEVMSKPFIQDCPDCEYGTVEYEGVTVYCPTCNGLCVVTADLELSTIPTVLKTEKSDAAISFTYDEVGDLGNLEFIWYLNDNVYKRTVEPSVTVESLAIGVYGMHCVINSSIGYTTQTNQFELQVNPATQTTYIDITEQPLSYTIKQGQAVFITLDKVGATDITWYVNDVEKLSNIAEIDLSTYDVGVYEIYCKYTLNDENCTSDIATVSIVNDKGETETNNINWMFIAFGGVLVLLLLGVAISKRQIK